jgi:hypothetical protein
MRRGILAQRKLSFEKAATWKNQFQDELPYRPPSVYFFSGCHSVMVIFWLVFPQ